MGNIFGEAIVVLFLFLLVTGLVDIGLRLIFNVRWCARGLKKIQGQKLDSLKKPIFLGVTLLIIEIGLALLLNQLYALKPMIFSLGWRYSTLFGIIITLTVIRWISWSAVGLFITSPQAQKSSLFNSKELTKWKRLGIIGSFAMDAIAITVGILFLKAYTQLK